MEQLQSVLDSFKAAKDAMKKVREEASAIAKQAFKEGSKALFEQHPKLLAFGWRQYTPYFNDSDPCVFGVNEPAVLMEDDEECDIEDNYWLYIRNRFYGEKKESEAGKAQKAVHQFINIFPEEILKSTFGDHMKIVVHRDGRLEEEEYDHE